MIPEIYPGINPVLRKYGGTESINIGYNAPKQLPNLSVEGRGYKGVRGKSIITPYSGVGSNTIELTEGNLPKMEGGIARRTGATEGIKVGQEFKSESQLRREAEFLKQAEEIRVGMSKKTGDEPSIKAAKENFSKKEIPLTKSKGSKKIPLRKSESKVSSKASGSTKIPTRKP